MNEGQSGTVPRLSASAATDFCATDPARFNDSRAAKRAWLGQESHGGLSVAARMPASTQPPRGRGIPGLNEGLADGGDTTWGGHTVHILSTWAPTSRGSDDGFGNVGRMATAGGEQAAATAGGGGIEDHERFEMVRFIRQGSYGCVFPSLTHSHVPSLPPSHPPSPLPPSLPCLLRPRPSWDIAVLLVISPGKNDAFSRQK